MSNNEYHTVNVGETVTLKDPRKEGTVVAKRYLRPDEILCVRTSDGTYYLRVLNEIVGFGHTAHIES